MEDQEKPIFARLIEMLERIDPWIQRLDPDGPRHSPSPGSPLLSDDRRTHPYETSYAAWHALSHAVDHLHMLRSVLRDARTIHMYAPFSLLRGAIENGSAAV
jgi:hypothetical protein